MAGLPPPGYGQQHHGVSSYPTQVADNQMLQNTKVLMFINRGRWTLSHLLLSNLPRPLHPITVPSGPHPIKFLHMRKRLTLWLYCRSSPSHPSLSRSPSHHSSPSHPSQHPALQVDYRISRDLIIRSFLRSCLGWKSDFHCSRVICRVRPQWEKQRSKPNWDFR